MLLIPLLIGVAVEGLNSKQECKKGITPHPSAPQKSEPVFEREVKLSDVSTEEAIEECRMQCCMDRQCKGIVFWSQEEKAKRNLQKEKCRLMLAPFGPTNVISGQKGLRHETLADFEGECSGKADQWIHEHKLKKHQTFVYGSFVDAEVLSEDECIGKCCNQEDCFGVSYYEREADLCKLWWVPITDTSTEADIEWRETSVTVRHWINPAVEQAYNKDQLSFVEWPVKRKRFTRTEERREAIQAAFILQKLRVKEAKNGKRAQRKDEECEMKSACTECSIESDIEQNVGVMSEEECQSICDKTKRCKAADFVRVDAEGGHCILKMGDLHQTRDSTATSVTIKQCAVESE